MSGASGLEYLKPFLPGLEPVLADPDVSEIMINGPNNVWIERAGKLRPHPAPALDERALARAAIHIARPLGLDPAQKPIVDCPARRRIESGHLRPPGQSPGRHYCAAIRQAELFARGSGALRFPAPGGAHRGAQGAAGAAEYPGVGRDRIGQDHPAQCADRTPARRRTGLSQSRTRWNFGSIIPTASASRRGASTADR